MASAIASSNNFLIMSFKNGINTTNIVEKSSSVTSVILGEQGRVQDSFFCKWGGTGELRTKRFIT